MRVILNPLVLLCVFVVSACSSVPKLVNEYKIDIQQGNVLTQEMVAQLRPGLTRDQVRYVLGSPVLTDIFHADRWDYIYRLKRGNVAEPIVRRFSVFFDDEGRLVRVSGDLDVGSEAELAAPVSRVQTLDLGSLPESSGVPSQSSPPAEKGWWGRMLNKVGL